jgi:hypothetical protein
MIGAVTNNKPRPRLSISLLVYMHIGKYLFQFRGIMDECDERSQL